MPARELPPPPCITLTTDFGLADPYVAQLKGVILGINPRAIIVDVSHHVRPQQIVQALYLTEAAWPAFPLASIHLAVVDPGVGTERSALVLATPTGLFAGPDNGVLSSALPAGSRPTPEAGLSHMVLPAGYQAFAITNERYLRTPVSATFHGRDIFAPAAAHLSLGLPPDKLGEHVQSILAYPPLRARRQPDGSLEGQVIHIDRFGNVISDIRASDLPDGPFVVDVAGRAVPGPVRTYAEAPSLAAIVGSAGYLEIALPGGDAASALDIGIGDTIHLRPA